MSQLKTDQLPFLDGLRGYAAVWVLISHALQLSGTRLPLISHGSWAVDVFIIMSGFLMAFHYQRRKQIEPWDQPRTWKQFWLRRFWRIAPLYYVLLAIAILLSGYLGFCRSTIAEAFPLSATEMERYAPGNPVNILMHVSFLFGILPQYAFTTPLPDWSIGLEAQFYAAFPFLMLLVQRLSAVGAAIGFCLVNGVALQVVHFPMPAFLPLKLATFAIGILLAIAASGEPSRRDRTVLVLFSMGVALFSGQDLAHRGFLVTITLLLAGMLFWEGHNGVGQLFRGCAAVLGNKVATLLADWSYSVYLVHLLFMLPIGALLVQSHGFLELPGVGRGAVLAILTMIPAYGVAMLLFRFVEKPGNAYGKHLIKRASSS